MRVEMAIKRKRKTKATADTVRIKRSIIRPYF